MIAITIVRRCICEVCLKHWDLEWGQLPPERCKVCGALNWEEGPEMRDATFIRKGITKAKRRLNPGAASGKRQARGKLQWQGFKDKEGNPV